MSDFDKEAEREKLREKYERDQEKRKSTQRMSELLLKGATMTNRHCEECGDPIFRYDGQEFCPTCQQAGGEQASAATGAGNDPAQTAGNATTETAGDAAATTRTGTDGQPKSAGGGTVDSGGESIKVKTSVESTDSAPVGGSSGTTTETAETTTTTEAVEHEGDLGAARESLIRSVERYARAAEKTDDPRQAKDHLAAAREAAEALNALSR